MTLAQMSGFADRFDRAPGIILDHVLSVRKFNIVSSSATADLDRKIMDDHFALVGTIVSQVYSRRYRAGLSPGRASPAQGAEALGEKLSKDRLIFKMNDDWRRKLRSGLSNRDRIDAPSESPVVRHSEIVAFEVVIKIDALIALQMKYPGLEKEAPETRAGLVYITPTFEILPNGKISRVGSLPAGANRGTVINYGGPPIKMSPEGLRQAEEYKKLLAARKLEEQNLALKTLANAVTAKTQSAIGPEGATPVAKPAPRRPASKKPLPKPKGRR